MPLNFNVLRVCNASDCSNPFKANKAVAQEQKAILNNEMSKAPML
jgi:hypothetical protein